MAKKSKDDSLLGNAFNASDLLQERFRPLSYVVPGMIPEGLSLFLASPKVGKSWLVLGVALAVSSGTPALGGIPTAPSPVLYLALEDGKRRLQSRLISLGASNPSPELQFIITADRDQILDTIHEFIRQHHDQNPLVILDTLGKVMPAQERGETLYDRDYRIGAALKRITDDYPGAAILVVHHTRKAEVSDFAEASSGTNGLTGAADTIILLKRSRQESTGTLHVTSRDAREGEYELHFGNNGAWNLSGGSLSAAAQAAESTAQTGNLGDFSREIIDFVLATPEGVSAADVAAALGTTDANARVYLSRAAKAGRVHKLRRGVYGPFPQLVIDVDFTGLKGRPRRRKISAR